MPPLQTRMSAPRRFSSPWVGRQAHGALPCGRRKPSLRHLAYALLWACLPSSAPADQALVAVAANFSEAARQLGSDFESSSSHNITLTVGSTGKLYAQILHGAPFDVLLAADQKRPKILETNGRAVAGSRFTYAVGRLALWSADSTGAVADGAKTLRSSQFRKLAMANPDLAPYGAAAQETLNALGIADRLKPKLVMGENIAQAHALVATGNAELGLVALSNILSASGSHWEVPADLHSPIRQDAVLLKRGATNRAATAFLLYLESPKAIALIENLGYSTQ